MSAISEFFTALFENQQSAQIEIRAIEDRKGGTVVARSWFRSAEQFLAKLPGLSRYAMERNAGLFFGLLPRADASSGTAGNVAPGIAVWADIDFRDLLGGETEARARLASLPLPPTAIIRSGHGLHVYYFLREPEAPVILSALAQRLGVAVGGDAVHDAARIFRVPGTHNMKNPEQPLLVEIELWEPTRRYNPTELDEILPALPPLEVAADDAVPDDVVIVDSLPPQVKALIDTNARARNLFTGQGKPETDEEGRALDTTSSGYDLSFLMALVRRGVRDFSVLANALWHRPDDAARTKGIGYIGKTVRRALALVPDPRKAKQDADEDFQLNFEVEKICAFASTPPQFVLTIRASRIALTVAELLSINRFRNRFVETLRWVPKLPRRSGTWEEIVNGWLAQAETIEQPPEASPEELVKAEIESLVSDVAIGEEIEDLDRGLVLVRDDIRYFKSAALLRRIRQEFGDITAYVLCRQLRDLGYAPRTIRFDAGSVRVWGRESGATSTSPISSSDAREETK